jgi:hypothetical protein
MANKIFYIINPEKTVLCIYAHDKFIAIQMAKRIDLYKYSELQYTVLKKRKKYQKKIANEK